MQLLEVPRSLEKIRRALLLQTKTAVYKLTGKICKKCAILQRSSQCATATSRRLAGLSLRINANRLMVKRFFNFSASPAFAQ